MHFFTVIVKLLTRPISPCFYTPSHQSLSLFALFSFLAVNLLPCHSAMSCLLMFSRMNGVCWGHAASTNPLAAVKVICCGVRRCSVISLSTHLCRSCCVVASAPLQCFWILYLTLSWIIRTAESVSFGGTNIGNTHNIRNGSPQHIQHSYINIHY